MKKRVKSNLPFSKFCPFWSSARGGGWRFMAAVEVREEKAELTGFFSGKDGWYLKIKGEMGRSKTNSARPERVVL